MADAPRRRYLTLVPAAGAMLAQLDLFIVNVAFPDIQKAFAGTTTAQLSWVLTGYSVVFAALLVPAGRFADRFGRRRLFRLGMTVFTVASAVCAAAPDLGVLVGGRLLQAVGAAMMVPTSLGLMLAAAPPARHARVVATWAAVGSIAAAAGPPIGGLLVEASWRWIFLVNLPIAAVAVLAAKALPEQRQDGEAGLPDLGGAVLLVAGVGGVVAAVSQAQTWGAASARLWVCVAVGVVGFVWFLRRSAVHPRPVLHLGLLRYRAFSASMAGMLLFYMGFAAMLLGGLLFLSDAWGWSSIRAGLAFAPGPSVAGVFGVVSGRLPVRRSVLAAVGGLVFATGALWWWLALTPHVHDYAADYLPGLLLVGASVGLTMTSLMAAGTSAVPRELYSTGAGVMNTARQIGSALGVALLVAVLGTSAGFRGGWLFMIATGLLTTAAAGFLAETQHEIAAADTTEAGSAVQAVELGTVATGV